MNRTQLLKSAVGSVLFQTFKDFELIVSDNSNNDTAILQNRMFVETLGNDSRICLIKPPHWMNMPDHWEFASCQATGQYVIILTDRHVMRPSALELVHSTIRSSPEHTAVVAWSAFSYYSLSGIVSDSIFTGVDIVLDSKQEAVKFAKCDNWRNSTIWVNRLPRMLNSCYRFDIAQTIRKKHGRLFWPVNPDYSSAFFLLAFTKTYCYIDRPLFMSHGNKGNGNEGLISGSTNYFTQLGDFDWFAGTPAPLYTVTNFIIRDMMFVKDLVKNEFENVVLDIVGYYATTYREIMFMQKIGAQRDIRSLLDIMSKNISCLSLDTQNLIKVCLIELDNSRPGFIFLRRLAIRFKIAGFYFLILWSIRRIQHKLAFKPTYANVLDAAQKTDFVLTRAANDQ